MIEEPNATPVTVPLSSTVANAVLELVQVTRRPVSRLPWSSRSSIASSPSVLPTRTESTDGIPMISAALVGSAASLQAASAARPMTSRVRAPAERAEYDTSIEYPLRVRLEVLREPRHAARHNLDTC